MAQIAANAVDCRGVAALVVTTKGVTVLPPSMPLVSVMLLYCNTGPKKPCRR